MAFPPDEHPTTPINPGGPIMTMAQVREALSAFPYDQQPLIVAMLRAADDNGYGRGWARLSRVGPFDAQPKTDEPKAKRKR